jgi:hypothetical protein
MVTDVKPEQYKKALCAHTAGGERGRGGASLVRGRARGVCVGGVRAVVGRGGAQAHHADAGHGGRDSDRLQARAAVEGGLRTHGGRRALVRGRARGGRVRVYAWAASGRWPSVAAAQAHLADAGHTGGNLQRRAPLTCKAQSPAQVAQLHICNQPARHLGNDNSAHRALSDCLGRLARPREAAPEMRWDGTGLGEMR